MEIKQRQIINFKLILFCFLLLSSCLQTEKGNLQNSENTQTKIQISDDNEPSIIFKKDNLPRRNFQIIDYDNDYLFVGRNYGDSRDFGGNTEPGFFVHSKRIDRWLNIKQILTKKGSFGYSKKLTKEETKKMMRCSVHLSQAHLANQEFCDLPLTTSGSIAFPDKITFDSVQKEYSLHFFSSWQIEKVKTILKFKKEDLDLAFSKEFKNKN